MIGHLLNALFLIGIDCGAPRIAPQANTANRGCDAHH